MILNRSIHSSVARWISFSSNCRALKATSSIDLLLLVLLELLQYYAVPFAQEALLAHSLCETL